MEMLLFLMDPVCGDGIIWKYNPLKMADFMSATTFFRFSSLGFTEISSKQNCLNALIFKLNITRPRCTRFFVDLAFKGAFEICTSKVFTDNFNNIEVDQFFLLVMEKGVVGNDWGRPGQIEIDWGWLEVVGGDLARLEVVL